jgi:serine phosphatase RsbU (regulator of sigma subunit)
MGRGVTAAAAMAQMRASILAYIAVDPAPESVLQKLDRLLNTFGMTQLITLVYLVVDPAREELQVVNAGHPPPVILRSDGSAEQLPYADGAPLGVTGETRSSTTMRFEAGDVLMAFTDGLIERRDEDIDAGQRRLVEHLPTLGQGELDEQLPLMVEAVRDHSRQDDVAAIAVRRGGS